MYTLSPEGLTSSVHSEIVKGNSGSRKLLQ